MPTTYPIEFKVKVILRYEKGESIKSLSEELHIAQSTLYQWRKEYCSIQTSNHTYTPKEFDAISRRLEKLERHLKISIISPIIHTMFMSSAIRWVSQGGHFIITSSAGQIEVSTRMNRLNSC